MELRLKSVFMKNLVAKVLRKTLKRRLQTDFDVTITELDVATNDENAKARIAIDISMAKEDLENLLERMVR